MNRLLSLLNLPSILSISRLMMTNPRKLYAFMPHAGGYTDPVIFVAIMSLVASGLVLLSSSIGLHPDDAIRPQSIGQGLGYGVILPLAGIAFSFLLAVTMFAIWSLFGSDQDFEVAYRCIAYSSVLLPVFAVARLIPFPYLGGLGAIILVSIWWFWLMVEASHVVHQLSRIKIALFFTIVSVVVLFFMLREQQTKLASETRLEQFNDQMRALEERASELDP